MKYCHLCNMMDLENIILSKVRERQTYDITYIWSLKINRNE